MRTTTKQKASAGNERKNPEPGRSWLSARLHLLQPLSQVKGNVLHALTAPGLRQALLEGVCPVMLADGTPVADLRIDMSPDVFPVQWLFSDLRAAAQLGRSQQMAIK